MKEPLIDFRRMAWESPAPGIRQKVDVRGKDKIRLVEFSDGFVEAEWCRKGHRGYVVQGSLTLDFNGRETVFREGDGLDIPVGDEFRHKARLAEGETALLVLFEEA